MLLDGVKLQAVVAASLPDTAVGAPTGSIAALDSIYAGNGFGGSALSSSAVLSPAIGESVIGIEQDSSYAGGSGNLADLPGANLQQADLSEATDSWGALVDLFFNELS